MHIVISGLYYKLAESSSVATSTTADEPQQSAIQDRIADVSGIRLHYLADGEGDPA